jgi:hypothetical protein
MADWIRAFGTTLSITAEQTYYRNPREGLRMLASYELDAQMVEKWDDVTQAREYLKGKGYWR